MKNTSSSSSCIFLMCGRPWWGSGGTRWGRARGCGCGRPRRLMATAVHAMGRRRTGPRWLARASGDETCRGGALGGHMRIGLAGEGPPAGGAPAAGPEVPHWATTAQESGRRRGSAGCRAASARGRGRQHGSAGCQAGGGRARAGAGYDGTHGDGRRGGKK